MRPPTAPRTTEFDIGGQIARADIPALCERVRVLLEGVDTDRVFCDVGALDDPDGVTVDALARVQLTARRLGHQVRLRHASRELQELLAFVGLSGVAPLSPRSRLEPRWQAEEREKRRGIEEEADPADPIT